MTGNRAYGMALLLGALVAAGAAASALPSAEMYVSTGLKAYKEGNLKGAAGELQKAINLKPDSLDAHYYLGRIALIQKDYYTAFNGLKEVLALQKDYKNAPALFRQLQTPLLEQVKSELKVNPRSARAYNVLGFLLVYQHRPNDGITQLNYALKFDPSLATAYDDLAWAYYQSNRFDAALKFSERAFTLDPVRASITRHYQQLFYLKRLGFAADQAGPERFYGGADVARPEPPRPPEPAAAVGVPAGGISNPADVVFAEGTTPATPVTPPPADPTPKPPEPAAQPVTPPQQEASVAPTQDLTRINIDDTAVMNAFLKDFKPKPAAAAQTATQAAAVTQPKDGPPKEAPPSAAEVAARVRALYKKGKEMGEKTDFDGAQQAFELLVQIDPSYRDANGQLERMRRYARTKKNFDQAMDYYQTGSFAAALEMLRGIDLATLREFRNVPTLDHMIGECYFRSNKFEQGAQKLAKFCEENPQDVKFRYLLAKCYSEMKEYKKALDEMAIIRATDPAYLAQYPEAKGMRMKLTIKAYFPYVAALALIWAAMSLGYFLYKLRQTHQARLLRHALAVAGQAQKEGDWNKLLETVEEYEQVSGRTKADVRVKHSKALALVQLGRLEQASAEVESLPDDPKRQLLRAKIRLETNDTSPEAMEEYRALLNAEPNNLKLLQTMNQLLQQSSETGVEAERILERLMELEPMRTEYVSQLAGIYLGRGTYDASAQKVFSKLLAEDSANGPARYGLARCHFESSHFVEAIREAKPLVEYDLDNGKVHDILVESYKSLGMVEEGEREYKRLLAAHPGNRALLDAGARLRESGHGPEGPSSEVELKESYERGTKLFSEGRFADAMGPLSAAFEGHYQRACAGALMVRGYLKVNEPGTALRVFERMDVYDQPPDEFLLALCYEMAALYQGEGKSREAMRLYNFICRNNVNYRDAFQKLETLQAAR